jgi:hypothetical protein
MAKPQYSGPWQRIRRQILARDAHTCQIRGSRCTTTATEVDHIVPVSQGGAWYDPLNLRGACQACNNARIDRRRNEAWRRSKTRIALVIGPPGPRKTEWVNLNKGTDDLVVDYDALSTALGARSPDAIHAATNAARNAVIDALRKGKVDVGRAWIISSNPKAEQLFPFHDVVNVDPGREEAEADAAHSPDSIRLGRLVRDWYDARNPLHESSSSRTW